MILEMFGLVWWCGGGVVSSHEKFWPCFGDRNPLTGHSVSIIFYDSILSTPVSASSWCSINNAKISWLLQLI